MEITNETSRAESLAKLNTLDHGLAATSRNPITIKWMCSF